MEQKDMRGLLEAAGQKVPESDEEVEAAFNDAVEMGLIQVNPEPVKEPAKSEEKPKEKVDPKKKVAEKKPAKENAKVESKVITYIGAGDTPPYMINFMGRQKFMRGKAVEVSDPVVLAKIENNPSFVEGELEDESVLFANDEAAAEQAQATRDRNAEMQKEADKRNQE